MSAVNASAAATPARPMRAPWSRGRIVNVMVPVLLIAAVALAWDLSVRLFHLPPYLLPAPGDVLARIVYDRALFVRNGLATLWVILAGFAISVVLGTTLALFVELNRTAERVLMPLIVGSQTIPKVAIAPLFVVWLGFGFTPKIVVTFLISFFPVVISTVAGLRAIELDMLDLVRSMGANSLKVLLKARLPTALPQMFSGIKIAMTSAVVGAIVAEFVGSDVGLGYLLLTSTASMDGSLVWSALLILVAMGVLLYVAVVQVERLVIPWHVSMRSRH